MENKVLSLSKEQQDRERLVRDGIIRIMRKRRITVAEISEEIPCHRLTISKFLKQGELSDNMFMMVEQWVGDNLKENEARNEQD